MGRAIESEATQTLMKNQRAPRGDSEQWGAISMRASDSGMAQGLRWQPDATDQLNFNLYNHLRPQTEFF
jgi:phage I-like protein